MGCLINESWRIWSSEILIPAAKCCETNQLRTASSVWVFGLRSRSLVGLEIEYAIRIGHAERFGAKVVIIDGRGLQAPNAAGVFELAD